VGRGANFIIPPAERLSVRVVAPLELRVQNIAQVYGVPIETARRRVLHRESRRAAFVKQSFHTDVADPENYDLVINTAKSDNDTAVGAIMGAISGGKKMIEKNY
jgi:cytidylate kinase